MDALEQAKSAIASTRNTASLLEDIQFRLGMETACDEIETRLGLTTAQPADKPEGKDEQDHCEDVLEMVDDLVVSWVGGEPPERVAARKRLEDAIRSILAAQGG